MEHRARTNLLSACVVYSQELAIVVLGDELKDRSSFEAGTRNVVTGLSAYTLQLCRGLMFSFCEARVNLRRAAFRDPDDSMCLRLVREDPYSKTLFGEEVVEDVEKECRKHRDKAFKWESLLAMKHPHQQQSNASQKAGPSAPWKN